MMGRIAMDMFDIRKCAAVIANAGDWYVAQIIPAKDRNTEFQSWERREVHRRFFRTCILAICSLFPGRATAHSVRIRM